MFSRMVSAVEPLDAMSQLSAAEQSDANFSKVALADSNVTAQDYQDVSLVTRNPWRLSSRTLCGSRFA
jgi:hypothetical protein